MGCLGEWPKNCSLLSPPCSTPMPPGLMWTSVLCCQRCVPTAAARMCVTTQQQVCSSCNARCALLGVLPTLSPHCCLASSTSPCTRSGLPPAGGVWPAALAALLAAAAAAGQKHGCCCTLNHSYNRSNQQQPRPHEQQYSWCSAPWPAQGEPLDPSLTAALHLQWYYIMRGSGKCPAV